jgi:hypothetical protein
VRVKPGFLAHVRACAINTSKNEASRRKEETLFLKLSRKELGSFDLCFLIHLGVVSERQIEPSCRGSSALCTRSRTPKPLSSIIDLRRVENRS